MNGKYLPEGARLNTPENREYTSSGKGLENALKKNVTLEAVALSCSGTLDLTVELGEGIVGVIPRCEATCVLPEHGQKDIAVISRVGKAVCFKVLGFRKKEGKTYAVLSRRLAQEECRKNCIKYLTPGDILPVRVTHEEAFGAFVDVGCGIPSLISIDCLSVSRIAHPSDRLAVGEFLRAAVKSIDRAKGRIYMTCKELFGTWEENAALFEAGQTVTGIVRSIEEYGVFIELTPNLAGLAEYKEGVSVGERAAVYIKSVNPEKMKIKLVLIDHGKMPPVRQKPTVFIPDDVTHLSRWRYSPENCPKVIETVFDGA
ncbi:MAG: 30S ribosomal protein S1 [Clostridia bacterium]|nr:30S ribosomal protein S1 [Clostridia bacterium]